MLKVSCSEVNTFNYSRIHAEVTLQRSSGYYVLIYLFPSLLFSYLSFAAFFMSHKVGERLGYGVTLLLTTEVSKGAMANVLPVCNEVLWMELFYILTLAGTAMALVESCLVLTLAYNTRPTLLPAAQAAVLAWMQEATVTAFSRCCSRGGSRGGATTATAAAKAAAKAAAGLRQTACSRESLAGIALRKLAREPSSVRLGVRSAGASESSSSTAVTLIGAVESMGEGDAERGAETEALFSTRSCMPPARSEEGQMRSAWPSRAKNTLTRDVRKTMSGTDASRLIYFERLFNEVRTLGAVASHPSGALSLLSPLLASHLFSPLTSSRLSSRHSSHTPRSPPPMSSPSGAARPRRRRLDHI